MIELKAVYKSFQNQQVLKNIHLTLSSGEQYVLTGSSGSGKSTLLYLMGGLDRPDAGEVWVEGQKISSLEDTQLAAFRGQKIGFVFQFHFLLPTLTALDNILLPARISGADIRLILRQTQELAQHLGVGAVLNKWPHQLSGGEQQRVNLIRALSLKPKILLCDEPTGNLDSYHSQLVLESLKSLATHYQATLLVVTHDPKISQQFSQKIKIEDGQIIR